MTSVLGQMPVDKFLARYWQRRPCVIRQAIPGFQSILDADELAGLACEEGVASRLVTGNALESNWTVQYGPLEDRVFQSLPENDWSLLIQDAEKLHPPLLQLLADFSFIPDWRFDDIMVSYAVPGGSVGPHVDQYDVFLLQADGRKQWHLAKEFAPDLLECELKVLADFEPDSEWTLDPGDMLYLPPGIAHHGIALDSGFTYSIGLRAPSAADLMQALGEWLAENQAGGPMYADPHTDTQQGGATGEISSASIHQMNELLRSMLNNETTFARFAGEFISRFRLCDLPAVPDQHCDEAALVNWVDEGHPVQRNPWTRMYWVDTADLSGDNVTLFAAGDAVECPRSLAILLCGSAQPELREMLLAAPAASVNREVVCTLINQGHLILDKETSST